MSTTSRSPRLGLFFRWGIVGKYDETLTSETLGNIDILLGNSWLLGCTLTFGHMMKYGFWTRRDSEEFPNWASGSRVNRVSDGHAPTTTRTTNTLDWVTCLLPMFIWSPLKRNLKNLAKQDLTGGVYKQIYSELRVDGTNPMSFYIGVHIYHLLGIVPFTLKPLCNTRLKGFCWLCPSIYL